MIHFGCLMAKTRKIKLPVDKLIIGLMVDLELSWSQHPFLFSKFKISSNEDISVIKQLNLKEITVYPEQSDIQSGNQQQQTEPAEKAAEKAAEQPQALTEKKWQAKKSKMENADKFRNKRSELARKYKEQASQVRKMTHGLKTEPANAIANAAELVESMASEFDQRNEILTNLVNLGAGAHTMYNHCINVMILSMSLASVRGIKGEQLRLVARGALLHDVGKIGVPGPILNKKTKLSTAENKVYQQHSLIGRRLCERVEDTPREVLDIIELHHEFLDGSGFPNQYKAEKIPELVRIVAVANMYDNLCNPADSSIALTPKIALATMYSKYKDRLDHELVQCFISTLGVYPPGSVVNLNDESIGLVISVDPHDMLNPEVLLYNPDIPPLQALIIDLKEHSELKVDKVLKPGQYPKRVYDYLGIEERIGYITSDR